MGRPLAGPASAYPTLRRPASSCLRGPNDGLVGGLMMFALGAFVLPDSTFAESIATNLAAAMLMAAEPRKRRRSHLLSCFMASLWFPNRACSGSCSLQGACADSPGDPPR